MKAKERLDIVLVERGLVKSRERAKALIMEGQVLVNGVPSVKPGTMVDAAVEVALKTEEIPYVSRGGLKLAWALDFFRVDPAGMVAMDIGCSTGGFTDCLLQRSARKVYAIDVGYGQFDWSLRNDLRVVLLEKTNIRHLEKERIPEPVDLAVIDVSFISLTKVLPKTPEFLGDKGIVIALIKPQFEVGKGMVGKGGIVRDEEQRQAVVEEIKLRSKELGFRVWGVCDSPVLGQKGNKEYLIGMERKHEH